MAIQWENVTNQLKPNPKLQFVKAHEVLSDGSHEEIN